MMNDEDDEDDEHEEDDEDDEDDEHDGDDEDDESDEDDENDEDDEADENEVDDDEQQEDGYLHAQQVVSDLLEWVQCTAALVRVTRNIAQLPGRRVMPVRWSIRRETRAVSVSIRARVGLHYAEKKSPATFFPSKTAQRDSMLSDVSVAM